MRLSYDLSLKLTYAKMLATSGWPQLTAATATQLNLSWFEEK